MDQIKASNATFLDDNTGGKGKYFRARILQAGLVKYSFGVCLLEKDTIDKFVYNFVGCPVIIDHKDVTNENAKEERVGVISRVWFEQADGWYWVEGIIFDEKAISLINDGYNVSCQYEISEYANNVGKKLHNGNSFDKVILNGKPEHLAIVKNPRYENAMIAVNALDATNRDDDIEEWITVKGNHIPIKKGQSKEEAVKEFINKQQDKSSDKDKQSDDKEKEGESKSSGKMETTDDLMRYYVNNGTVKTVKMLKEGYFGSFPLQYILKFDKSANNWTKSVARHLLLEYEREGKNDKEKSDSNKKDAKNSIIQAINEIKETDMFKNLFKKKENKMDKDELKSLFMECLSELTAKNEADEDDKLADEKIADNEDDKEGEKKDEKKADNKCKNDVVDKRDIIRQIMAIAGKEEASEDVKEIAKLAEKLAYDKSEADKKADNKCKNEDDKDDDKKVDNEEKEDEKEKASNSLDEIIGKMSAGTFERKSEGYMTQKKAVELGDKLF